MDTWIEIPRRLRGGLGTALLSLLVSAPAWAEGLLSLEHRDDGSVHLAQPPLGQPLLLVTSLPHGAGSNDIGLDRGQLGSRRLVQFEQHGDKLLLRQLNTRYRALSDNDAEVAALTQAFAESLLWVGSIEEGQADISDLLMSDLHGIQSRLADTDQGHFALDRDRSLVLSTKMFPENADLDLQLTFSGDEPGAQLASVTPDPTRLSLRLRYSFVALPETPMAPRRFHPESGFFAYEFQDYAAPLGSPMTVRYLVKHRLEKVVPGPAPSKVVEPIVYYLDPGTPEPMRTALLEGARWWTQGFEAVGFLDAFRVELLPEGADPQDIRYNLIQWVHRSTRGWSYGDSLVDPRSGEILKGHVTLGSLRVRQDHKIFRALTAGWADRDAAMNAATETALARLRQLAAHEVGHTLGLAHNFAASASGDPSVMDYPHPDVRVKGGRVNLSDAYGVGLSDWDRHALRFGYGHYDGPESLTQDSLARQAREAGMGYVSDPDARGLHAAHAEGHLWDNGEDPIARLDELLAVRANALAALGPQALLPGEPASALGELLVPTYLLHRYQVEAVARQLGGVHYDYQGRSRRFVEAARQKAALERLLSLLSPEVLALPEPLVLAWTPLVYGSYPNREQFASRNGPLPDQLALAEIGASQVMTTLLAPQRLNRMAEQHWSDKALPSPEGMLAALSNRVFGTEGDEGLNAAIRARLQAVLVDRYLALYHHGALGAENRALVRARILADAEAMERGEDPTQAMLVAVLRQGLDDPELRMIPKPLPLPPGSPI